MSLNGKYKFKVLKIIKIYQFLFNIFQKRKFICIIHCKKKNIVYKQIIFELVKISLMTIKSYISNYGYLEAVFIYIRHENI